ncbi:hypothetical protein [uncultured Brachyspira sp.]|uniref:hypothetical protein n=1 Tax=uncultured Brachyspira sp. TaxID=221953 RepID=UPI002624832D|nr:hypothetical protein [uncultured Brachyspira sp.]
MYSQDDNNYRKNNRNRVRNNKNRKNNVNSKGKYNNRLEEKESKIRNFDINRNVGNDIIEDNTFYKDISSNISDSNSLVKSVEYKDHRDNLEKAINEHTESLNKVVDSRKNMEVDQLQGYVAEADLAGSYNEKAAIQGKEYETQAELTKPGDPEADIILRYGNKETKYQVKSYKDSKRNTEAISEKKYSGKDNSNKKIVPEENLEKVKEIASKKLILIQKIINIQPKTHQTDYQVKMVRLIVKS